MNKNILKLVYISLFIEAIITYANEFFILPSSPWQMLISLFMGIAVSIAYGIDLPAYLELNSNVPCLGNIITGIILSRGSNYIYDFISNLNSMSKI